MLLLIKDRVMQGLVVFLSSNQPTKFYGKIPSTQTHCSLYFVYDIRSGIKFLRKKVGLLAEGPGLQKDEIFCKGALSYILHLLFFLKIQSCAKKYIKLSFLVRKWQFSGRQE